MLVRPSVQCFNYGTYDRVTGLYVAAKIYDITTLGSPIFVSLVPMTDQSNGNYVGSFIPQINKTYLVIAVVFTDNTYATVNIDRPPAGGVYDCPVSGTAILNFAYGAYDFKDDLSIAAEVFDLTSGAPVLVDTSVMTYVDLGFYVGQYTGANGETYSVFKNPSDTNYAFDVEPFQAFSLTTVVNEYPISSATLIGQSNIGKLKGQCVNAILEATEC